MSVAILLAVVALAAGCHSKQTGDATLLERISRARHSGMLAPKPGELAEKGGAAIAAECEKQSYQTARKGLIVSETGLHEDVFALRDRVSYAGMAYGLDEALRLEVLLRREAQAGENSAEQANCIQEFAEHLETVTDPLVEGDERQKELDASAFKDSAKEAQEQADRKLRGTEKTVEPKERLWESLPPSY